MRSVPPEIRHGERLQIGGESARALVAAGVGGFALKLRSPGCGPLAMLPSKGRKMREAERVIDVHRPNGSARGLIPQWFVPCVRGFSGSHWN